MAKTQVMEMLTIGLSPAQISTTLGVSESYISQLMADEDFAAQVQEARVESAKEDLAYDNRLDTVEEGLLSVIENKSRFANLQQATVAFKVLNSAKRRKDSARSAQAVNASTVINITIPSVLIPQYVKNSNNEIIEVEGQTMVSASPKRLEEIVAARVADGTSSRPVQLPGITKVERAAGVLKSLDNKPRRLLTRNTKDSEIADLL